MAPILAWAPASVRRSGLATWDVLCWFTATAMVLGVRLDFGVNQLQWMASLRYVAVTSVLAVVIGVLTKFYRGRFRVGSFDEALGLAGHFAIVGAISAVGFGIFDQTLPRSIPILVPPIALIISAAGRMVFRAARDRKSSSLETPEVANALVYGAGDAAYQILGLLKTDRNPQYRVVGLIEDSPSKRHLRLHGVQVIGTGETLAEAAEASDADVVILAITTASGDFIGKLQDRCHELGLEFLTLPPLSELIGGQIGLENIRKVEITDVLGRHPIQTDLANIADYLMGKRVLITGAGGSIGSELARQVNRFGPSSLVLLDRDESALLEVQLSLHGQGLLQSDDTVLSDIRDAAALDLIFEKHRPEIVFHAAALKHLPLLERFPEEGWKTNVLGSLNVLDASARHGVAHVVNISTDKAADSTSVLGKTKRLAEGLTAHYAAITGRSYISVRFGNVLGSRGSMLHTFNAQIARGGPLTVTHPEVTRFFMTIPEACELVIQAGAMGQPGEVLVLDMGRPVKIVDVAKRMISISGKPIRIVFSGLRPGEKLHEVLFSGDEAPKPTAHPLINSVEAPIVTPDSLPARHSSAEPTLTS